MNSTSASGCALRHTHGMSTTSATRRWGGRLAGLAVSIIAIVIVVSTVDVAETFEILRRAEPIYLVLVLDQTLQEIAASSGQFVGPLQDLAFASLGMLGNLIFMIFLSLFVVIDKENLLGFVNRVTPTQYAPEMRLFQTSVASSFGGFMRGQAIQALVLGSVAAAGSQSSRAPPRVATSSGDCPAAARPREMRNGPVSR